MLKEIFKISKEYGIKNTIQWRQLKKDQKGLLEKLKLPAEPQRVYTKERVWKKEYEKLQRERVEAFKEFHSDTINKKKAPNGV